MKKSILAAIAFVAGGNAQAVNYTLNVPVNISNLTAGTSLTLNCRLCQSSCTAGTGVAVAHQDLPVSADGSYSGTMSMVFSLTDQQASSVARYECHLSDGSTGGVGLSSRLVNPNSNSVITIEGNVQ